MLYDLWAKSIEFLAFCIAPGGQMARNREESLHGATKSLER